MSERRSTANSDSSPRPTLLSRPLEALVFLVPLILFYEIGCIALYRSAEAGSLPGQERVVAFHLLRLFFELFGSTGVWMPGLAVVVILLCTHIASRAPWKVRGRAVGAMYIESLILALPLLVFSYALRSSPSGADGGGHVLTNVVLGVGAGIYEEFIFRLVLVSLVVMVASDFFKWTTNVGYLLAIAVSAVAFSAHHHPPLGSEPFELSTFLFRGAAGAYLALLFIYRGYGPAAGAHAAYNVLVAIL